MELTANLGRWMVGRPEQAHGKSYYVLALPEAEEMDIVDAAIAAFSGGDDDEAPAAQVSGYFPVLADTATGCRRRTRKAAPD